MGHIHSRIQEKIVECREENISSFDSNCGVECICSVNDFLAPMIRPPEMGIFPIVFLQIGKYVLYQQCSRYRRILHFTHSLS